MTHNALPGRGEREAGSATLTTAIIFPAVGLLLLALLQAMMVSAAGDIALAAAEEGLHVARGHQGTTAQGHAAALQFARAESVLRSPAVTVTGTTTITVRVTGTAPALMPGVHIAITRTARGPRERFTLPGRP